MTAYLISSDAYALKAMKQKLGRRRDHLPPVSVVVPAHNEELTIERSLESLYKSNYPASKLEVIVANDGSTDKTGEVVRTFQRTHKDRCKICLVTRPNKGKAAALNYAIRNFAGHRLIMCLDADSSLERNALRNAVQHFRDRNVVTLASNVNILEDGTLISLIQKFEYIVCYQMKKGQALLRMEYIVGGIGSMFRRRIMEKVSFYDTNTMTEDIDLTMKILASKSKKQKIAYAGDSIVYTEPAHSLPALLRQRFRWKYGRNQTFWKHTTLFFSRQPQNPWRLTWFMLPFSLFQDMLFFFEPFIIGFFLYLILRYGDTVTLASACTLLTLYLLLNIWSSDHLSVHERLRLSVYSPPMYLYMYLLSFAEYFALIKAVLLLPGLKRSIQGHHTTWRSPERKTLS